MKVSLITVTYNSAVYLEDCIRSVVGQQYHNIEHIIIDGGSTDGTVDIIRNYHSHIAKWISVEDRDMYEAINKGIKMATGDIVGILNSDDVFASNDVIGSIVDCFNEHKLDAVYGDLVYVDKVDTNRIIRYWKGLTYNRFHFLYGWMPAHPTFYLRRELIDEYGGYLSHYYTAADYEFMARYLYRYRISARYLPKLFVKMRVGGQSNITLKSRLRANRRDYLAMKKNQIPFPFFAAILKPIIKLHQFYYTMFTKLKPGST
ncbi:MAG: glycosyltransferase [Rhizobacter sp.]|nr:glycosyltransferase [Ferruginibacter sp.]